MKEICLMFGLCMSAGCAIIAADIVGTQAWFDAQTPEVQRKAAFDLSCPANDVKLVSLAENNKSVGASGCGQKTTYLYIHGTGWSRNSEVLTSPK